MQVVTDAGADYTPSQVTGADIRSVPLTFVLDGVMYRSGIDIMPAQFYELLAGTESFPTTSQPSPGDFETLYRKLVQEGKKDILSVHISSGLSGTINSARVGAQSVPEANVTFFDTLTLSGAEGWHVEAAVRMLQLDWALERIVAKLVQIREVTETYYTLATLKYLEHGGRISHIQALLGQVLDLKPIIGVEKQRGTYVVIRRERSLKRAIDSLADVVADRFGVTEPLRVQVMHGYNSLGAERLLQSLKSRFKGSFLPTSSIAPVLGAHTGPGLVGVCAAPLSMFADIPGMV